MEYPVYTFTGNCPSKLVLYFGMTLDLDPADLMSYDIQIDDGQVQTHHLASKLEPKGELPDGWFFAVQDCIWKREHILDSPLTPGEHVVKIRLKHTNVMLEKLVLDLGGLKESYLGPPASFKIHCGQSCSS